jgi:nucleotide-binding universal stress UspA family protein
MKTILAPIDFSDASTNALNFAAELAQRAKARLIIVNVLQENEDENQTKKKLEKKEFDLKEFFGSGLKVESALRTGSLVTAIKNIIAELGPDIVAMGTKGASGLKRVLIGSNTVNVIGETTVPVLVIPEIARFENFLMKGKNRIVLATDLDELKDDNALDILKEIALLIIEPKIRVVSVRPKNTNLDYMKRMEREALLSRFNPEVQSERVTVFSSNVIGGINFYLNKNSDTGLVAMIARDSGALIQKHYTHEMASHTNFPLLVMHDKN